MKYFLVIIIICFFNFIYICNSYGEGDQNGLPIWQERESLNLMNAVRLDPIGYKNYFMKNGYNNIGNVLNIYPKQNPVYHNSDLNKQARYHSIDMGNNNCFSHSSCDGTSINYRVSLFNSNCTSGWGENLSAGFPSGVQTQNSLICETPPNCVNDGNNDGHRSNMMSKRWIAGGVGYYYAPTSTYKHYWSQEYKDATCQPQSNPIYSGSHSFWPNNDIPMFHVSYYNNKYPNDRIKSAKVIFSSGSFGNLKLVIGSENKGFYNYIQSNDFIVCDSYIFEFITNNGKVYRYPDTGSLSIVTIKGSCKPWTSKYIKGSTESPPSTPTPKDSSSSSTITNESTNNNSSSSEIFIDSSSQFSESSSLSNSTIILFLLFLIIKLLIN
ncbi:hypothetical protein ACTFIU_009760 [Dictyostelium citrinum]